MQENCVIECEVCQDYVDDFMSIVPCEVNFDISSCIGSSCTECMFFCALCQRNSCVECWKSAGTEHFFSPGICHDCAN